MKPVVFHREPGLFWIRVFGKGFLVKDSRTMMFSERNGFTRGWFVRRLK